MKKLMMAALAAGSMIALASPAAAQTATGTINITGSVAAKCLITNNAGNPSSFTGTVALGELAQANGTLRGDVATTFNAAGAANLTFRVVCTSAAPVVTVNADPIVSSVSAPAGYANTINYQADVAFAQSAGGSTTVSNDSTAAATTATIGRLAASPGGTNVAVTAQNFRTAAATDLLVADPNYTGLITIMVAPGA